MTYAVLLGASVFTMNAQTKPDNTGNNKGDPMTAEKQKTNAADQNLTAQIRKAIVADKSLSMYAHNIKIITQNGVVTLKGPVRSDDEITSVMAKATDAAGSPDKVVNQLTVAPPKTKN